MPKKYEGLDGTELAISESQERMAVVVDEKDIEKFCKLASKENIETTVVATVTKEARIKMYWREKIIVNISRDFLNTNGTVKNAKVKVEEPKGLENYFNNNSIKLKTYEEVEKKEQTEVEKYKELVKELNCCSKRGLVERFDSSIGAGTVFMPFGGKYQLTPSGAMCARIPTLKGYTNSREYNVLWIRPIFRQN